MQIRGAGNVFGEQQKGNVGLRDLGVDMYLQILQRAMQYRQQKEALGLGDAGDDSKLLQLAVDETQLLGLDDSLEAYMDNLQSYSRPAAEAASNSRCVLLENLLSAEAAADPAEVQTTRMETGHECAKWGALLRVHAVAAAAAGEPPNPSAGRIFVEFETEHAAAECAREAIALQRVASRQNCALARGKTPVHVQPYASAPAKRHHRAIGTGIFDGAGDGAGLDQSEQSIAQI